MEKEYLTELRNFHHLKIRGQSITQGDVVTIHDGNEKRNLWRMGLVEELILGVDGRVRAAHVRVSVNGDRTAVWKRPVERLYPLEIVHDLRSDNTNETDVINTTPDCDEDIPSDGIDRQSSEEMTINRRPKPKAAAGSTTYAGRRGFM